MGMRYFLTNHSEHLLNVVRKIQVVLDNSTGLGNGILTTIYSITTLVQGVKKKDVINISELLCLTTKIKYRKKMR